MDFKRVFLVISLFFVLVVQVHGDYIWHKDEIPYASNARCRRGTSYYTNVADQNVTDINSVIDYLQYNDTETGRKTSSKKRQEEHCLYCICSMSGEGVTCLNRNNWFCQYYNNTRSCGPRCWYAKLFEQDRPLLFASLSHRVRRTMSDGIYQLLESVGSGLDRNEAQCLPFVSEYTDCTEANMCTGCQRCSCTAEGQWSCRTVHECSREYNSVNDESLENAWTVLLAELKQKKPEVESPSRTKSRHSRPSKEPLDTADDIEQQVLKLLKRQTRSVANYNSSVVFHHTVDELNADTLKDSNASGTIEATKVDPLAIPLIARRRNSFDRSNKSALSNLYIEHNQPQLHKYNDQITDNVINSTGLSNDTIKIIGNHTQIAKNKELSKVIVGELRNGIEYIGDKHAPVVSNITFTPENDTFTAMAFIAGNLLSKLWNLEKNINDDSMESELLKHEKIADLIDLFKEPLNVRQESFLKNALEKITTIITSKNDKKVSICNTLDKIKDKLMDSSKEQDTPRTPENEIHRKNADNVNETQTQNPSNHLIISKINEVLNLIAKFEKVKKDLYNIKYDRETPTAKISELDSSEEVPLNLFGNLLEKVTKLLLPNKITKKLSRKIKETNLFKKSHKIGNKLLTGNNTLTAKDKLVLDYLTQMENKPDCFLKHTSPGNAVPLGNIEGDILLNLSEYIKIKSFADLMNIVQGKTNDIFKNTKHIITTELPNEATDIPSHDLKDKVIRTLDNKDEHPQINAAKEKLKDHLKSIIKDLMDLQNASGLSVKNNHLKISDVLPCISRFVSTDSDITTEQQQTSINVDSNNSNNNIDMTDSGDKIKKVFDLIKNYRMSPFTRRSGEYTEERPQTVVIWERTIKNLDRIRRQNRKSLATTSPVNFEKLLEIIKQLKAHASDTYEDMALFVRAPPSEKLILLKTLEMNNREYVNILESLIIFLNNVDNLPLNERNHIEEFIDFLLTNIKLIEKILRMLGKTKAGDMFSEKIKFDSYESKSEKIQRILSNRSDDKHLKVTRDQVLSQLIKNRVQMFIRIKEAKVLNLNDDVSYNIARTILDNLNKGNIALAKELYKVLILNKGQRIENNTAKGLNQRGVPNKGLPETRFIDNPVVQTEDLKGSNWFSTSQDRLFK